MNEAVNEDLPLSPGPVFMCSGQGSQKPGMGADLLSNPQVSAAFECASDVFGRDIADLCVNASPEELNDTRNAQAVISALSIGIARALMARGVEPCAVLGFSLGQISALAVAGMVDDETAFRIVAERSRVMGFAADEHPGVMSAFLKADLASVQAVCDECAEGQVLVPANLNCPGQIVVAGEPAAVERAEAAWKAQGKRSSRLATSGAFHSPLMEDAAAPFAAFLANVKFSEAKYPLICNVDAKPLSAADAPAHLVTHLTHPVHFEESVRMLAAHMEHPSFVEVGFGGVLEGLVKRIDKEFARACVKDAASFEGYCIDYLREKEA